MNAGGGTAHLVALAFNGGGEKGFDDPVPPGDRIKFTMPDDDSAEPSSALAWVEFVDTSGELWRQDEMRWVLDMPRRFREDETSVRDDGAYGPSS